MTRSEIIAGLLAAAVSVAPLAAGAQTVSLSGNEPAQLELGGGGYDIDHDNTAGVFRGEYRFANKLWIFRPLIGEEVTTDGASYTYGGFGVDIFFGDRWVLTPNEAVGFWGRGDKDSKNLGSWVEFRSGAELAYRLDDQSRIGVSFHHISNAGLTRRNPGEEELLINYSIPLPGLP